MRFRAERAMTGRSFALIAAFILAAIQPADGNVALGASFTVNTTADAVDANPGDGTCATAEGPCSLRAAIQEANALPGEDRIVLPAGQYTLSIPVDPRNNAAEGDLDIEDHLDIEGEGTPNTIIDGGAIASGVFQIRQGIAVVISGSVIQGGGHFLITGGGILNSGDLTLRDSVVRENIGSTGAGLANSGTLTVRDVEFIDNRGPGSQTAGGAISNTGTATIQNGKFTRNLAFNGGAISNGGQMELTGVELAGNGATQIGTAGAILNAWELSLTNSVVSDNEAGLGGGIFNDGTGKLAVRNTTISGNVGHSSGGGIRNQGEATLEGVTVSGNATNFDGAGIHNTRGALNATNTTISGNSAGGRGGGIANIAAVIVCVPPDAPPHECPLPAAATLTNTTISDNTSQAEGAGIFNEAESTVAFGNSIVAGNSGAANCFGQMASSGHNVDSDGSCGLSDPGDLPNTDPLLGPLADNGGPTKTHALLAGSPAIDAGDPAACPATDQRGVARPQDGTGDGAAVCDIGAYELEGVPSASPTPSPSPTETSAPGPTAEAALPIRLPATGGRPSAGFE